MVVDRLPAGSDTFNVHLFRVRAHQTDLNAAMYHGAYLDIFDDARIETFRHLGYTYESLIHDGCAAVIRRVECEFRSPAWMDDMLSVTVTVDRLRAAGLHLRYVCRRDDQLLAVGRAEFAFLDAGGKPQRVPAALRQVVERNAETLLETSSHSPTSR